MATKKLGQLCGINITRIPALDGVRVRCEFVSVKHQSVEFEISGDLALGIAKELELLLPMSARKRSTPRKRQRVNVPASRARVKSRVRQRV